MTHNDNTRYFNYIKRIKINPIATVVNLADLKYNSNFERLEKVGIKDLQRLELKITLTDIQENQIRTILYIV